MPREILVAFGREVKLVPGRANMRPTSMIVRRRGDSYTLSYGRRVSFESMKSFLNSERVKRFFERTEEKAQKNAGAGKRGIMYGGKEFIYFGRTYPVRRVTSEKLSLRVTDSEAVLNCPESFTDEEVSAYLKERLRAALKDFIDERLPVWENATGLKASRYIITTVKSYWGKMFTDTRVMRISDKAVQKSAECIDYLIVHELVHIRHNGHGRAFRQTLAKIMPDWKEREKKLKSY